MGVPQGFIMGPLLFLIYDDSLAYLQIKSPLITYADDTVIYSPISWVPTRVEVATYLQDLHAVSDWCATNRMSINVKRTKAMILGLMKKKPTIDIPFKINEATIAYTETYKYLGLLLNKQLTMKEHVSCMIGVIATKIKTLSTLRANINSVTSLLI